MKHPLRTLAAIAFLVLLAPASGHAVEDGAGGSLQYFAANENPDFAAIENSGSLPAGVPVSPVKRGTRFVIIELHQAQRNLDAGDPRINLMFDSKSGKTWVLQYTRLPGTGDFGYVWVEVPQRAAAKPRRRKR